MPTQCTGCTLIFLLELNNNSCQRCRELAPKPRDQWKLCEGCGNLYEHLANRLCGTCAKFFTDKSSKMLPPPVPQVLDAIEYAMQHPVDPRTHSKSSNPNRGSYVNPVASLGSCLAVDERRLQSLRQEAVQTMDAIGSSYPSSKERVASHKIKGNMRPVVPLKVTGLSSARAEATLNKVQVLNVIISKIEHRSPAGIRAVKDSSHNPRMMPFPFSTQWSKALEEIRVVLDTVHDNDSGYRIWRATKQYFSLRYNTQGRPYIDPAHTQSTVGNLWMQSISCPGHPLVKAHAEKSLTLELVAVVVFPPPGTESKVTSNEPTNLRSRFLDLPPSTLTKRKSDERLSLIDAGQQVPFSKRTVLSAPSGSKYYTTLRPSKDEGLVYIAQKTVYVLDDKTQEHTWKFLKKQILVYVHIKPFASGATKHVYKLRMNEEMYAAKSFYNIGRGPGDVITNEENLNHLQDEIFRQSLATHGADKFYDNCRNNLVSIVDIEVEQAFILQVSEGPDARKAWMVAPLLDSLMMRKFSGTMEAGKNTDSIGRTCDALAHFSVYDSNGTAVLVDIQGITVTPDNSQRRLVLFDLMFHSDGQGLGLGDAGVPGIKQFYAQHQCNNICQALNLEPFGLGKVYESHEKDKDTEYTPPPSPDNRPLHPELEKVKANIQAAQRDTETAGRLTRSAAKLHDK